MNVAKLLVIPGHSQFGRRNRGSPSTPRTADDLALAAKEHLVANFAALLYLAMFDLPERDLTQTALLALGGLVTVIPLVCFGAAASRLPLSTLGFFQYIAPSLSLFLALYVYQEIVPIERWINLGLIWIGLAVYSLESLYQQRRLRYEI